MGEAGAVRISEFQEQMARLYLERDRDRGVCATLAWIAEELGELSKAVRKGNKAEVRHEAGDLLAWLASLCNQLDVDLEEAAERYAGGCPKCGGVPCRCP